MAMLPVQAPAAQGPIHEIRPRRSGGSFRGLAGPSDERLVAIAKDGDERAFEILYERHAPAILRYCRSLLRSTQEAEDVKQEVFVLAISALRRGAEPDAFRPWLYRVAHNACMSHLRMRRPVLVADNGVLVGPAGADEPVQHHREELRQLLDDIGKLPDVQRGALLLRELDGFSYEQVGEVLDLPLSTVRASIFRARRTLQGLAAARDADCEVIQSELSDLADRRGRRGRHITNHLNVCSHCRDFRDGLRRRPTVLSGVAPASPLGGGGVLLALKGKLLGGAAAGGATGSAVATVGGGAGVAKIAAVAASSIALLAGAGVEADHVIDHSRRDAAVTPRQASAPAARAASAASARATAHRAATGAIVVSAADSLRAGRLVHARPVGDTSTRFTRAPARVKESPAKPITGTSAPPRANAPAASTPTAPAATATATTAGGAREEERGETGGDRDRHSGSGGDEGSRESESGGGSNGSGSGHGDDDPAEVSAPRSGSSDDDAPKDGSGMSGGDDTPRTPTPTRFESSGHSVPPRTPAPEDGSGDSSGTSTAPEADTPVPEPDPAPADDPPAAPAPDPTQPADPPPADPATIDASTTPAASTTGTTADTAAAPEPTQP
jgi:RNA polymerase sigma factor (sigma-70 family)